jgi:hypothetical protein
MGWARATLLYDLLGKPPKPGTPLESLILMVWQYRQTIRLHETRSIVQAVLASGTDNQELQKAAQSAWETFMDELLPYQRGQRKRNDKAALDYLKREVARGPLRVIPLVPLKSPRSRLKAKGARK